MLRVADRIAVLAIATLLWPLAAHSQLAPSQTEWINALRSGGHVIVIRHGATPTDQAHTDPLHLENVDKQRQLNDSGRAQALRKLAATLPSSGTDVVIVTHRPNILDTFGKVWFDVKEEEASIFKPDGDGGYKLIGRL